MVNPGECEIQSGDIAMIKSAAISIQIIIGTVEEKTKPQIHLAWRGEFADLLTFSRPIYLSNKR
jgi:hypothetical protein